MIENRELTPESLMSALFGDTNTSIATQSDKANIKEISLDKLFDYPHHNFKTPEIVPKPKSVKYAVPEMYFPSALKKKEKEEYILKTLQYVQDNGIVL